MKQKMAQQIRPSKPGSKKPRIDWSRREEADNFAQTVKLYRQGKIDHDNFRRFRLQHGAYGTRMTDDYAMVRKGERIIGHLEFTAPMLGNKMWDVEAEERK